MKLNSLIAGLAGLFAASSGAFAAGTVCFDLNLSIAEGASVRPGTIITWTITARASQNDHQGLALGLVDMVADAANPAPITFTTGAPPTDMQDFNLPRGFANRGVTPGASGYGGTPRPASAPNGRDTRLVQIGGAQNTFGNTPAAPNIGTDTTVNVGVGQLPAGQVLARGTFPAPSTNGIYTIRLAQPIANTLVSVQEAPGVSRTSKAITSLCDGVVTFKVTRQVCIADINRDGIVTDHDLYDFVDDYFSGKPIDVDPIDPVDPLDPAGPVSPADPSDPLYGVRPIDIEDYLVHYYKCRLTNVYVDQVVPIDP